MSSGKPQEPIRLLIDQAIAAHEAVAAQLRLSPSDLRCLNLVASEPDMTPSRLAELSGLTAGAITGVLDRLEADGFVRRQPDTSDRRRSAVELDPDRWADVDRAYEPLVRRAATVGRGGEASPRAQERYLAALTQALADEALRLRAATRGGMIDGVYMAPANDAVDGRLVLATGAPRLNVSRAALGQRLLMVAETAATRLHVKPAPSPERLVRATFVGPPPDVRTDGGVITMRYRRRMIDVRSREVTAELSQAVDWAIEVTGGITDLEADLESLPFNGLDVRGGVNHLRLRLPRPSGTVRLRVEGGSSDARISRPAEVPVALVLRGGGQVRFDGRRMESAGSELRAESDAFSSSPDRYEVEILGGAAQLRITANR
jgi:DNA-binding MarR family transcriptional regulator